MNRTVTIVGLLALSACASSAPPVRMSASEVLVQVRNASAVPLSIRLCGDPCTEYTPAAPDQTVEFRLDTSRQQRFVTTAKQGDRMVAQEAFITAGGQTVVLSVSPPIIQRVR